MPKEFPDQGKRKFEIHSIYVLCFLGRSDLNADDRSEMKRKFFLLLVKISLWGNKCDLSISSGNLQSFEGEPAKVIIIIISIKLHHNDFKEIYLFNREWKY